MRKVIIIGGGAAGMMAAISASKENKQVLLLERNEKLGKKLFITGKGRCNITSGCPKEEFLSHVKTNHRFLYSAFSAFSNEDMIAYLKKGGLDIKEERGQRIFPASDRSSDVISFLKKECERNGVRIRYGARVKKIWSKEEEAVFQSVELENGERITGDCVILASGGKSYAATGSDGDGYRLAKALGHTIKPPCPSLVPFIMEESWCKELMGLALKNVSIRIRAEKKMIYEGFGEFLFTHFGVSGPLVLTASTCLGTCWEALKEGKLKLSLDLKASLSAEQLEKRYLREFDTYRNKNISNVVERMLPRKMVPVFLQLVDIPEEKKVREITKKERRRMVETMKNVEMHILDVRGFEEAIVTRGGVCVKEVQPSTMESKKIKGVYFAGEVLDVDAVTGGFNLQIAWSTGFCAGKNA